jgi:hypothetical protein
MFPGGKVTFYKNPVTYSVFIRLAPVLAAATFITLFLLFLLALQQQHIVIAGMHRPAGEIWSHNPIGA